MSAKPSGHEIKCGCWSCTEHRRDNARLRKFRMRWAEREVDGDLAEHAEITTKEKP